MDMPEKQFRVVFTPKNFEASDHFYRHGLELPIDHEWDAGGGDKGVVFMAGGGMIEILGMLPGYEYVQPVGIGLLLQVDDVDQWGKLAAERNLKIMQEPFTYPWGQRILRLSDPDGVIVSLFTPVSVS